MAVVFGIVIFGVFIMALVVILVYFGKKRQEALSEFAQRHGMHFSASDNGALLSQCSCFSLFGRGGNRKVRSILSNNKDGLDIRLFEYSFRTRGARNSTTHVYTVCFFRHNGCNLPSFKMTREGVVSRVGHALGGQDIDFDNNEEFSKMWVLKGDNEKEIRQFFTPQRLQFFAEMKQRVGTILSQNDLLLVVRYGRVSVKNYDKFFEECLQIAKTLVPLRSQDLVQSSPFIIEE